MSWKKKTGNIRNGEHKVMDISDVLEEKPMKFPRNSEHLFALEVLENFFLFSIICEGVQVDCLKDKKNINKHFIKNTKQTTIKDFLKLYY